MSSEIDLRANRPPFRSLVHHLVSDVAREAERFDECLLTDRVLPSRVQVRHETAAAHWLERYHNVHKPSATLLCGSGQQALACALLTLCKSGDTIAAEESVYLGVILLAGMLGLKTVPIPIDKDGIVPRALATLCKRERPKVVFCMPNLQSPTTVTLPEDRRQSIAALARQHDFWIIEDDVLGAYVEHPLAPFRSLLPERSILFTSFSKVIALGAATGIVSVPPELQDQMNANIRVAGGTVNPVFWEAMTLLIDRGQLDEVIVANRAEVRSRVAIAESILGDSGLVTKINCPHAWLPLPTSTTLSDFMLRAHSRNIKVMRSDQFAVNAASSRAAVRITLGGARDRS
ncbi:MAG: PLP-dependent aminotransferase family protein, partial [bacterium]